MKVSLNWLKEFVEVPVDARRLKADLVSLGLNAESFQAVGGDVVFEVEITANRPDCLSHYGVAREVAAFYRRRLAQLDFTCKEIAVPASTEASIEILNPELCPRYCGRVVRDVQVKPSPEWLVQRLEAVGQRSINNVADVTNYVLMELGHPLHAFDLIRLEERKVVVRSARQGEQLRTLDGVNRTLSASDLVIADSAHPVALAGVMGGEGSGISDHTHTVLLESAWFDPGSIRRTSKSQGLHTEASHRFERGADIEMAPLALDRAAILISQLAGGKILRGVIDVYPVPRRRTHIDLRRKEIQRLLGAEVSWEVVERVLRALNFKVERRGTEGWRVTPPLSRLDVNREVDLIEEVARHYGYNRLPARVRPAPPRLGTEEIRNKEIRISGMLAALGYREIIPSAMVDPAENARFTDRPPVVLENPLSQDASAMRSSAVPSMLHTIKWNLDRLRSDLRLFEMGKVYSAREKGLPDERRVLVLGATGKSEPPFVHGTEPEIGFFDLKGDLEQLLSCFDLPRLRFEPFSVCYLEDGQAGRFVAADATIATFGRLNEDLARGYKLRQAVFVAEVDLDALLRVALKQNSFKAISKFPQVERDFSLVLPCTTEYGRLEHTIQGLGIEEIQSLAPIERRSSEELPAGTIPTGHASLLLRVTFQSPTRTLASDDVEVHSQRIISALDALGVQIRAQS
ncbi:MAG: phenylalanine--tRNA ligase subunit beta [Acidobacteria bacterium]|nr:MAG: phenylalanine--tRNA ligase subunit beta [Acidobacteriota bacterium]